MLSLSLHSVSQSLNVSSIVWPERLGWLKKNEKEGGSIYVTARIQNFYFCMEPVFFTCPANTGKDSYGVDTSLPLSAVTYWIIHAQYFAMISLNLKLWCQSQFLPPSDSPWCDWAIVDPAQGSGPNLITGKMRNEEIFTKHWSLVLVQTFFQTVSVSRSGSEISVLQDHFFL